MCPNLVGMKILIVEDELELANDMEAYLETESYHCERAATYQEALDKINHHDYDCILLDLMLPGGSGLKILEELKAQGKQDGSIIISAKNAIEDKVEGLQLGADDYLAKPFHLAELSARIHSLIRRKNFQSTDLINQNELKIDLQSKVVRVHGNAINLTKKEYELLLFFIGNKNRVISKGALAEHLSGDFAEMFNSHDFVYAHVKNLKRKLKEFDYGDYLKSVYGLGYKWEA